MSGARALLLALPLGLLAGVAALPVTSARAPLRGAQVARGASVGRVAPVAAPAPRPLTSPVEAPTPSASAEAAASPTAAPPPPSPSLSARYPEPSEAEVTALERAEQDPARLLEVARATAHPLLRLEAVARALEADAPLDALLPWGFEPDDPELHAFVGAALADGGPAVLAPALERWLSDPRASVRLAASDALLGLHAREGSPDAAALAALAGLAGAKGGAAAVEVLAAHERVEELQAWALRSELSEDARVELRETLDLR